MLQSSGARNAPVDSLPADRRKESVTEIEETLSLRQPAISQQLARLRADGLVRETRRQGKNVYYSLARPEVTEVIGTLHRTFCEGAGVTASGLPRSGKAGPAARAVAPAGGPARRVHAPAMRRR